MTKFAAQLLVLLTCLGWLPGYASEMTREIDYLLDYVANTDCRYERNGKLHSGQQAVEHIRKKYDYFKDKIDSTERFIELAASKSTVSGRPYHIHCDKRPVITSQQWLLDALSNYRDKTDADSTSSKQ